MNNERKEIVAGRGFYYMPSAFVTLNVTVEGVYDHARMEKAVLALANEEKFGELNALYVRKSSAELNQGK